MNRAVRSATVKDVAAAAGVSASTVSNVLHDRPSVDPGIRRRVEDAIAAVGYVPSVAGRLLRSGRSTVIELAVPDIRSPYYTALAHTVIGRARGLGLTVTIAETDGRLEYERETIASHPNRGVAGVLMCPIAITSDDLADLPRRTPTVLLGEHTTGDVFDQVAIDSVAAADEVASHLIASGRRRIAFVGADRTDLPGPGLFRVQGVARALGRNGLALPDAALFHTPEFSHDAGARVGATLPVGPDGFDAVVCATDEVAIGLMHALRARSVSVPSDVAVSGWDDSPDGRFAAPPLTTVAHDLADVAGTALGYLVDRFAEPARAARRHVAPHHLLVRASTLVGAHRLQADPSGR